MFSDAFGSMVFNENVMKAHLKDATYTKMMKIRKEGMPMDPEIADEVAEAMKNWAVEKGATHYTHWFQPMTGITAEKHTSFLDRGKDGEPILSFSGKALIKGESDASSFPSGGIRATFEARGFTVWDPTSDAFIKENTLCIPTAFCSFNGAVLDKKTPLLRSIEALNKQALRVLDILGEEARYVYPTAGLEQEYFLINKADYAKRTDLILTGRTLFGAVTPKGQILADHYTGSIRPRVKAFMEDLDEELWKLGVYSQAEHNEAAPCQHEMAPVFARVNIAIDNNQITMETMKKVANRHDFVCLLHEKPFAGINGSGKHNNWSLSTDTGENLFRPGSHPETNDRFLLFLAAVVRAVDDYQDLLRISVASAGNDHRLGGNEAPPAIISMYLGRRLMSLVEALIHGTAPARAVSDANASAGRLMHGERGDDDRNRTSPFAFTGNRFEFRMPGSSDNVSCTNYIINTSVAESLRVYADRLEAFKGHKNLHDELMKLVTEELKSHERIFFDGNGYGNAWMAEAKERGLCNFRSTPEAFIHYDDAKNVELFKRHGILSVEEIEARKNIGLTEYTKIVNIEARTMLLITDKEIIPAAIRAGSEMARGIESKTALGLNVDHELKILNAINEHVRALCINNEKISDSASIKIDDPEQEGMHTYRNTIPLMEEERRLVDELEVMIDKKYWPYPDYTDLLYYV